MRCVAAPAIQQRPLQDAEIVCGEVSWAMLHELLPTNNNIEKRPECPLLKVKRTSVSHSAMFAFDPNVWTRRALQGKIVRLESVVSHQCIRPRIGADAPGHHGNPRTPDLITGHASKGYLGSSVLGCAGKTICPSTLFSRRPGWEGQRGVYIGSLLVVSG